MQLATRDPARMAMATLPQMHIDVTENENEYNVKADLPGVRKEGACPCHGFIFSCISAGGGPMLHGSTGVQGQGVVGAEASRRVRGVLAC
jgi:hypothetical protein